MSLTPQQLREACIADYATFCAVMQDDGWFDPVHEEICHGIQNELVTTGNLAALRTGKDDLSTMAAKILIVLPRGSLKSSIVTKLLPCWLTLQSPNVRCLIAGNTMPNASKKIDNIRGIYDAHEIFRALFPELLPDSNCRWTSTSAEIKRDWCPSGEGTFESAGMKTQVVGRHFHVIIEDDTVAPEKDDLGVDMTLPSNEDIDRAIGWHRMAIPLQLAKGPRIRVVVTTRWSDNDLVDYIERQEKYVKFDYPALRSDGITPTFSIFYSREQLDELKQTLGSYMFSALYLNKPIPAGDRLFRATWFHSYTSGVPLGAAYYVSIDPAISEKDSSCETVLCGCYQQHSTIWVNDIINGHLSPADLVHRTLDLIDPQLNGELPRRCGIILETNAYQKSISYYLHDELRRRGWNVPIFEVNSRTSKEARIAALQPLYENGQIMHRKGVSSALETQLIQYPHGRLVDIPDALSQQMVVYRGYFGVLNTEKPKEDEGEVELKRLLGLLSGRNAKGRLAYSSGNITKQIALGVN